ncbi:hypothetical protein D9758_013871 [Tetrapyrgos nigripes]|uniref:Uncharacterized protein n=1 Tax=Tetrapyrgos nigripes TaxID=182062 RepID=A0A8H5FR43_9AGAR|nr:hypothetical protein D9758_013871 [Tetrapyrgos nigripes]
MDSFSMFSTTQPEFVLSSPTQAEFSSALATTAAEQNSSSTSMIPTTPVSKSSFSFGSGFESELDSAAESHFRNLPVNEEKAGTGAWAYCVIA